MLIASLALRVSAGTRLGSSRSAVELVIDSVKPRLIEQAGARW